MAARCTPTQRTWSTTATACCAWSASRCPALGTKLSLYGHHQWRIIICSAYDMFQSMCKDLCAV